MSRQCRVAERFFRQAPRIFAVVFIAAACGTKSTADVTPAPRISEVTPTVVSTAGGDPITIRGSNFSTSAQIKVGPTYATAPVVTPPSSITARVPAAAAIGTVDVAVENAGGGVAVLAAGLTYEEAPEILSVSPSAWSADGGVEITVSGTRIRAGASALVGGSAAQTLVSDGGSIKAVLPKGLAGFADVSVTNPLGLVGTLVSGFRYLPPPTIASLAPSRGTTLGGTMITIVGADFPADASVLVGASPVIGLTGNETNLVGQTPPGSAPGVVPVVVTGPTGSAWVDGGFTYE